ncbi:MAG: F0F1 ATP synthase subunit B [Bacteroidales bacterium]|nr:F0F1 ATP synthase subunit B [Bacteroidales bacterium]
MSLITPDFGLLFWMTLIFGIVFFILAKFGFPVLTDMVRKRQERIEKSIRDARDIEARMAAWKTEQAQMMEEARRQQAAILREASEAKAKILSEAKAQAREEADKILSQARTEIAAEKESALRDVRRESASLAVEVAEKILRRELSDRGSQRAFIDTLLDEANEADLRS